jgi:hypothetical protein
MTVTIDGIKGAGVLDEMGSWIGYYNRTALPVCFTDQTSYVSHPTNLTSTW